MTEPEDINYRIGDLVEVVHDMYGISRGDVGIVCGMEHTYGIYVSELDRRRTKYVVYDVLIDSKVVRLLNRDIKLVRRVRRDGK
jgi:hypothetical protein